MSQQGSSADPISEAQVAKRRGISVVWIVPIVAAIVAGYLAYTTLAEKGPTITITFKTAASLEAGKTKVKHKNVDFGQVTTIRPSEDLSHVIVTAEMTKEAAAHMNENTRFWVVRPRLGAGGVSGLDTLVSGAYIDFDPGDGESRRDFEGLEVPPVIRADVPGKEFLLVAEALGSLGPGAPIYFRGISVGEVSEFKLAEDNRNVRVRIFVRAPFDELVHNNSRFWNASGFDISMGADGLKVNTESLETLLAGGVAFETPLSSEGQPAEEGAIFNLYKDQDSVEALQFTERIPFITRFQGSVRGLQVGAPVEFRGIRVGTVSAIAADFNAEELRFEIPVTIDIEPGRVPSSPEDDEADRRDPYGVMGRLVEGGLRSQLVSGNLITGQLYVALEFFPDAEPAKLELGDVYPAIPSVPSSVDQLKQSVQGILAELASLELPALIADARQTLQSTNALLSSPQVQGAIASLQSALARSENLMAKLDNKVGPLLVSLTQASESADQTLKSARGLVAQDSEVVYRLQELLRELTVASRSIRVLADYLESHPEALLRGKAGTNSQ